MLTTMSNKELLALTEKKKAGRTRREAIKELTIRATKKAGFAHTFYQVLLTLDLVEPRIK